MTGSRGADRWTPALAALATVLTLWSMTPVVDGRGWLGPSLLMVLLVLGVGTGMRWLQAPATLIAPAQVVGGLLGLTAVYAGSSAVLGLQPGPEAVRALARIVVDGGDTIQRYQAPVPISDGISLLIAAGVLAVAVLVDLTAVTLRSPAAAGLPLLTLYCVPAAVVLDGLSWRYFVAAALGWLLLLAHDSTASVLRWGRLLPRWGGSGNGTRASVANDTGALAATGRRLGVAAVAAAVLVPSLAPGLSEGLLTLGGMAGGDNRIGGPTVVNPVLTLRDNLSPRRDVEVLRYRTDQPDVAPLRILTADSFDGDTWKPATTDISRRQRANRGLPTAPGLASTVPQKAYSMQIEVGNTLDQDFLPLPYPTTKVDIDGAWLYDITSLNVLGDGETVRNKDYGVEYLSVEPTIEQLRSAVEPPDEIRSTFTRLPRSLPGIVRTTAAEVTKDAVSKYDKAVALQQWFRETGDFTYSTQAPSDGGGDAVAAFLREKQGFCIQYASAMAVMSRALGIPARIGIGFLPGTQLEGNERAVKLTDAHAWPELYFEDTGWVRFEPTPASRAGSAPTWAQPSAVTAEPTDGPSAGAGSTATSDGATDPRIDRLNELDPSEEAGSTAPRVGDTGAIDEPGFAVPWRAIGIGLLLLAAAALSPVTAMVARWRRRRAARDDRERIEAAWADLYEGADDLGVPLGISSTPRQLDAELATAAALPSTSPDREALARVAQVVERSRYSRSAPDSSGVDADVRSVLRAVASTRSRSDRVLARVLPRSGTARIVRLGDRAGRLVGGLDHRLTARLNDLRHRRPRVHRRR